MTRYWTFKGSLTTPPCTEGLRWTVLKQVQPISKSQLDWFKEKLEDSEDATVGSNRVVQPLYERVLYDSEAPLSTGDDSDDEDEESEDEDGDADDDFSVSLVGSAISAATVALLAF